MQSPAQPDGSGQVGGVPLTEPERRLLLHLARQGIAAAVVGRAPSVVADELPTRLREARACFVTLWRGDQLRGCIGQLIAREPLWEAVVSNAVRAATKDQRFVPVTAEEVDALRVEISILSSMVPLEFGSPEELLAQLRPGVDGVVLRIGEALSTFLPQVWEDLKDKEQFMAHLSRKGGHDANAWRRVGVAVSVYQVEHFEGE